MEKEKQTIARHRHSVLMEERKKCVISGIVDIAGFHEKEIILRLEECVLVISGDGLRIGSLHMEEGKLDICGAIATLAYEPNRRKNHSFRGLKRK